MGEISPRHRRGYGRREVQSTPNRGGLFWLPAAFVVAVFVAAVNAWVLLVEVVR
jgi:hypothetical protein